MALFLSGTARQTTTCLIALLVAVALTLSPAPADAARKSATKVSGFGAKAQTVRPYTTTKFNLVVKSNGRASKKRTVALQKWDGKRWVRLARATTNSAGKATVRFKAGKPQTVKLRIRVTASKRARAVSSQTKTMKVRAKTSMPAYATEMLTAVNKVRAKQQTCGDETKPPVPPLKLNARLNASAMVHAVDMVTNNFFSHTGSNGSSAGQRIEQQGYRWSSYGENIAAGYPTVAAVVQAWLESPGHCKNMMSEFTELGVAMAKGGDYGIYWVQNFATPASQS